MKRQVLTALVSVLFAGSGFTAETGAGTNGPAQPLNPVLKALEPNRWVKLHEQKPEDKVRFKMQEHGGSCFDTKRCRFVLFGSNTHGKDWTNTPLIFDVVTCEWIRCYPDDSKDTYTTNGLGMAVAGEKGDHPWAMHTFGTLNYDPERDELVNVCYPGHMKPGKFTDVLKDVWGKVKVHPTWTYRFADNTWVPLTCPPQQFFPYCAAWDSDRKVVVGYGGPGIWELGGEPRVWKKISDKPLTGWHNNAVYDSKNKAVLVFGSNENSNDMVVYRPATGENVKMPTPGIRPAKDQHCPMAFDPEAGRAVVVVDRTGDDGRTQAETWLYDLESDSWAQIMGAEFSFGMGMNYCMEYDPRHKACLLMANAPGASGQVITMYALKVDVQKPATGGKPSGDTGNK